jgi:hypothetical protein
MPDALDPPLEPNLPIFSSVVIVQLMDVPLTETSSFVLPFEVLADQEPAALITVPAIRVSGLADKVDVWLVDLRQPVAAAAIRRPVRSAERKRLGDMALVR